MKILKQDQLFGKNKTARIFNNKDFFVIDKSPGENSTDISSLICHRLDRDTSGLLIIAKNKKTKKNIQAQFKKRKVLKKYLALVLGKTEPKFKVEGFIFRDKKKKEKRKFIPSFEISDFQVSGKEHERYSETKFKTLKIYHKNIFTKPEQKDLNYFSLIKAQPITGRTHQIRLHLQNLQHPILGDDLYGGKIVKEIDKKLEIPRLLLHASQISFYHPETEKVIILKSKLPADFNKVLERLKES